MFIHRLFRIIISTIDVMLNEKLLKYFCELEMVKEAVMAGPDITMKFN